MHYTTYSELTRNVLAVSMLQLNVFHQNMNIQIKFIDKHILTVEEKLVGGKILRYWQKYL